MSKKFHKMRRFESGVELICLFGNAAKLGVSIPITHPSCIRSIYTRYDATTRPTSKPAYPRQISFDREGRGHKSARSNTISLRIRYNVD